MKVLIIGAGLGGLACAITCRRAGLEVLILERSPSPREYGAGIQIPPNGAKILQQLDLLSQILEKGSIVQHVEFRRYEDGRLLSRMPFGEDIVEEFGVPWIIIHRQDFHQVLLDEAIRLGAEIRLAAEVTDVVFDGPEVVLAGGERVAGNVIIGADGLHSHTRDIILSTPTKPQETGDVAYRAIFTRAQLESLNDNKINELCFKTSITSWLGPDKHLIFYPVRGGEEFNLVLLCPDNLSKDSRRVEGNVEEMRASYEGWDGTLTKMISSLPAVTQWKLTHLPELDTWTKGPVTLLGDACHPTLPYQAQGAAMAVEDGFAIGKLLGLLQGYLSDISSEADPACYIPAILKTYESIRKSRTTVSVQAAVRNRRIFHVQDGIVQVVRDFLISNMGMTRKSDWTWFFSRRMRWTLDHDLAGDVEREFERFKTFIA